MTQKNSKIGILKYVAKTKGVKFDDQPETWYNPETNEAREMVKDDYKGRKVEIILSDTEPHKFKSMILLEVEKIQVTERGGNALSGVEEIIDMSAVKTDDEIKAEEKIFSDNKSDVNDEGESVAELMGEEKVSPRAPLPKEEEDEVFECEEYYSIGPVQMWDKEYYNKLNATKGDTKKLGTMNLTYMSWAESWDQLKKIHPDASYKIFSNKQGMPYFSDHTGGFVRVSVKVCGLEHEVFLPIMDHRNKSVLPAAIDTFVINKSIQRAFAKAIAMHGLGLYVYKGEDYPEEEAKK